jgi:hypothetical protein
MISRMGVDPEELREAFEALETKDYVAFDVYRRRKLATGKPPTLQEIGDEKGVSRERVRQIENRFELNLRQTLAEDPDQPLRRASLLLAERLGGLVRIEEMERAIDDLAGATEVLQPQHRVRLLLDLAGPYETEGDWCTRCTFPSEAQEALDRLTEDGPLPLTAAVESLAARGCSPSDAEAWIDASKRYRILEGHLVRGRSLADRGVAVLTIRGEPMTLAETFAILGEQRSLASFRNQMQADPRVIRRGLKHYGLVEWGGEEYTSVADEMAQEIERRGGSAPLDELAQFLHHRFGVSPASVKMYAQGVQFRLDESGRVAVASTLEAPGTKPLPLTRGCFRLRAGWAFRRTVDHDVLRGSGSAIPLGFAKELCLQPTGSLKLETPYGPISCSWPSHSAHIGTLRRAAEAHQASEGDYLFVVALGNGQADVLHAAADWAKASDLQQLAERCGCGGGTIEDVAIALGIDATIAGSLPTRIRQQLLHRDEGELAGLVPDEDNLLGVLASL